MAVVECFFNGEFIPVQSAVIPISDLGFIHGVTVTEQLRTFQGKPFLMDEHLERFQLGLSLLEIDISRTRSEVSSIVHETVARFLAITGRQECAIGIFATPGVTSRFGQSKSGSQFCVYCYPLPHDEFAKYYQDGVRVAVVEVRDTEPENWPKSIKVRSRLHYYLADLQAKRNGELPILIGSANDLRDLSNATPIFVFQSNQLTIPPEDSILDSISLKYICRLAESLGIQVVRRRIAMDEMDQIQSMAIVNSLFCLARVKSISGAELSMNSEEFARLQGLWIEKTGVDFTA